MAKHKHVQDKLRQEILDVLKKHDGQVTYEAIMEMQYLEQVLYGEHKINIQLLPNFKNYNLVTNFLKKLINFS